ncbi:serine/threonine-protein kinase [Microbispora sp. H11081]|uniref:serine/threonine-protein kinase n=1 Tax=Microbispora sp. H11081 TaxID=2729107 RepID=UPI00147607BE|nr:serine/threonine-protein kinase [Microbispora sp. H11081]
MNRPELQEGDVLTRRYLLQERIATGGMSVIWRAFDQSLQRLVAIKVLDGSLDDDSPGRELMRREARATARLIHPDAIEVYDYGETVTNGGRLASFVVMRLLEGRSLADRIMEGPLPWAEATEIAAGLAKVLAAAHDRGIVHRDVTPENVLLADDGPKLLDFGIAAFIGEADDQLVADFGTPPYVAPERLKGTTADPAVDVYALGVLLFEMLTGALPYPEKTWEAIEAARREGPPPVPEGVPGLPQEVADLCRRCLCPDPVDRPSARAVAAALSAVKKPPGPRGSGWGAAAVGAAALGGVLWFTQTGGPEISAGAVQPTPSGAYAQATASPLPSPPPQVETVAGPVSAPAAKPRHTVAPVADPVRTTGPARHRPSPTGSVKVVKKERTSEDTARRPRHSATGKSEVAPLPLATTAPPLGVDAAVRQFNLLVDGAEATHDIDDDVALDLKQVLRNSVDSGQGLAALREKIEVRHREGRLPLVLKGHLLAALDRVEAALAQARNT